MRNVCSRVVSLRFCQDAKELTPVMTGRGADWLRAIHARVSILLECGPCVGDQRRESEPLL